MCPQRAYKPVVEDSSMNQSFAGQFEIPTTSEQETGPERHGMCVK